jgi:hypothetical protein
MGSSSLPEVESRLAVWRRAINLFHEVRRPPFVGPFKAVEFDYVVHRAFLTTDGHEKRPDIVGSGRGGWAALELTADSKSKSTQLDEYRGIDPRYLGGCGLRTQASPPDTISGRTGSVDDGDHCQIIFGDTLQIRKVEQIANGELRTALANAVGADLSLLPSIPITLLPESKGFEIRRGIESHVLQAFRPPGDGVTLVKIVDDSLDRIADHVGAGDKRAMIDAVRDHLRVLVKEHLPDHLRLDGDVLRPKDGVGTHSKTLEAVARGLKDWAGKAPRMTLENEYPLVRGRAVHVAPPSEAKS